MTRTAMLFPGQGAQFVGMAKDLCETFETARKIFSRADDVLDFPLSKVCFEGPESELNRTDISQPAILVHSWAVVEVLRETDKGQALLQRASVAAGLSLGEYSALAFAGALAWEDAVRLVRARGRFMQEACDQKPSTMASIVGLDDEKLAEAIKPAQAKGIVVAANFNAPGQVAISGETEAVAEAIVLAKQAGAKLAVPLSVAGAFHSPLMEPARERLAGEIEATAFAAPRLGVICNVDAREERDPARLKRNLVSQLTAPVLWAKSMQKLLDDGVGEFVEIGPGNVLAGLLKRTARGAARLSLGSPADLSQL